MDQETAASVVHRQLVEAYPAILAGELEGPLELIDPDVIDHRGGRSGDDGGRDAWRQRWELAGRDDGEFHDLSVTIEQNVTAGEMSVNRYTTRGTHTATGRTYAVLGMDMVRVRDGRVVEHWAVRDSTAIRHQIGLNV
jgi:ketosteroid isomerase-like protein